MAGSIVFGTGKIISVPSATNPTPVQLGEVIDLSVDINSPLKSLIGSKQFPIAVARGAGSIALKAKLATFYGPVLRDLLAGASKVDSERKVESQAAAIPATPGPYTVTVTNSANFDQDLGVVNASTGSAFTRVASAPATGQYSVSAGVYTFASADEGDSIIISYAWNDANGGSKFTVTNQLMGYQPVFSLSISGVDPTDNAKKWELQFHRVVAAKLAFSMSNEDFAKPDLEMQAFADPSGNVYTLSTSEND
jgi:hypothetical protein